MTTHAFIFARGGSKGLPRKNVKLMAGKPLIQYSIDTAKQSPSITHTFVSTEDEEIAAVAKKAGALVILRPKELATDTSPEWLAWQHAIDYVTQNYGPFEVFVSLPPTSPLRAVQDVEDALTLFQSKPADVCISMTPANRSPFFNMVKKNAEGYVELVNKPDAICARRQDAPPVFDITTVVYVAKPQFILEKTNLFAGEVISIEVPKVRAIDIDDIYDFMLAETIITTEGTRHV